MGGTSSQGREEQQIEVPLQTVRLHT